LGFCLDFEGEALRLYVLKRSSRASLRPRLGEGVSACAGEGARWGAYRLDIVEDALGAVVLLGALSDGPRGWEEKKCWSCVSG
jgi:hypothetical protein